MIRVAVKFGAFVVVCMAITVYLAFTIGNIRIDDPFGRQRFQLTASFDDVTGLLVDDNVKVAGVVVGKVTRIRTEAGRAHVTFQVDDDTPALPADSTAAVRWRNLIGQRYLYLVPGTDPTRVLQDGDHIDETTSVVDLGELFDRLGPIVGAIDPAKVNTFLDTVTEALDGREDKLGEALEDLATLAQGLGSRDQAIQSLLVNLETVAATINRRDDQIAQLLQNLVDLSETFADNTAILDAALVELSGFSTNLDDFLRVNEADLGSILGDLALVTDTVRERLPELDGALGELEATVRAVHRAGRRGEFLNQKILCAFVGPPSSPTGDCPTPVVTGLSDDAGATRFSPAPTRGAEAVAGLLALTAGGAR
jgi:phospholipid/cholesterol/gamma-HCH transport system substrate-binding protein